MRKLDDFAVSSGEVEALSELYELSQASTKRLDHFGIVAEICQQIDLIGQIDAQVGDMDAKSVFG